MVNFETIDVKTFLTEYWQKKPLLFRNALPNFTNPLTADELAGLALEDDIESRMVFETPGKRPHWVLKPGPFTEKDFAGLPKTHWTLLVQGVDKFVPEVLRLLDHFSFIPQWRVDDVMISYAVKEGSVGPHYDNYDVFLYQASGQRQWRLTAQNCHESNRLEGVDLRIMAEFVVEEEYLLSAGDMLYLPPHIGHHGISLSDDCMTYSFGYRSYQAQELWDSYGDYLSEYRPITPLYQDPNWATLKATSLMSLEACLAAKQLLQTMLTDDDGVASWFGCFATRLDSGAESLLPLPLEEIECGSLRDFIDTLTSSPGMIRDAVCRFAYLEQGMELFVNGCVWETEGVSYDLVALVANQREVSLAELTPFLSRPENQNFLYELWRLQWLQLIEDE